MGWVWQHEDDAVSGTANDFEASNPRSADRSSTRKVVSVKCRTEEVEPGKFVKKPSDVVQSNKEYTEEDVTDQMVKGSFPLESPEHGLFDFPGLRSDMEAIERSIFGGMSRFFEAAEEMKNGFFNVFGDPHMYDGDSSSSSSRRRGIPIEGHHQKEASREPDNNDGYVDLPGLARDV
ncbi:hypothetical protein RJ639_016973 [Escallonia herrerae]|uniref:Uncharacterized protein n=1 Tax=Escallonia herrerae TaxID=1293975 RepID=A0AA89ALN7_9ASTE|nr:hypothetical protein RJ639_016973 [Escallonia herrerae]